ncbi:MAG: hypothetical protein STSR0006_19540 [Lentimicrobium sp.]
MECPICHHQGIESLSQKCPECGADLASLGRIQKLRQRVKRNYIMLLSLIVVLVIAILIGIFQYHSSTSLAETKSLSDSVTLLIQVNQKLSDSLNILEDSLQKFLAAPEVSSKTLETTIIEHIVVKGESLWKIAEKYLGDGSLYSKIARDNFLCNPSQIAEGQKIIIHKNP